MIPQSVRDLAALELEPEQQERLWSMLRDPTEAFLYPAAQRLVRETNADLPLWRLVLEAAHSAAFLDGIEIEHADRAGRMIAADRDIAVSTANLAVASRGISYSCVKDGATLIRDHARRAWVVGRVVYTGNTTHVIE